MRITSSNYRRLIRNPAKRFIKFRMRKAIDFAIVSATASIDLENGIVRGARIVLGGVAYKPYRSPEAEKLLIGEEINENLATEAAAVALDRAIPLSKNGYKVKIAQTLVKRAIWG
jgi:xanthine dehydrogenase YagS FAD-binding subunit